MSSLAAVQTELSETREWSSAYLCYQHSPERFAATHRTPLLTACQHPAPSCSLVQFLSRCLKLGRAHSHPERNIGRAAAVHTRQDSGNRQDGIIIECALALLPNALLRMENAPGHYAYFVLILLKDILKGHTPERASFSALYIAQSLHVFSGHVSYGPALAKLMELCMALIDEKCLEAYSIHESLDVFTAVLATFAAIAENTDFRSPESHEKCKFIEKEAFGGCFAAAYLFSSVLRLLNRTLAIRLYPDLDMEKDVYLVESLCNQVDVMLRSIIGTCGAGDILAILSEDDPSLMLVLLGMLEIQLRLSVVSEHDHVTKNSYSSLLQLFRENGFDPTTTFLWFINDGLCMDTSVLVDLVSSSETVALKYVLRIVKYVKLNFVELQQTEGGAETVELFLGKFSTTLRKLQCRKVLPFKAEALCLSIDDVLCQCL